MTRETIQMAIIGHQAEIKRLTALLGDEKPVRQTKEKKAPGGKRELSPEARERIAAAQRKRWDAARKAKKAKKATAPAAEAA